MAIFIVLNLIILSSLIFIPNQINFEDDADKEQSDKNYPILLRTSDYSSSTGGNGGDINVSLHQSIEDITRISITNMSDPNNNSFTIDSPKDTTFNSSLTRIEIDYLTAENKTIEIEKNRVNGNYVYTETQPRAASFQVTGEFQGYDVYLDNVSVRTYTGGSKGITTEVYLFNATWDGLRYIPNGTAKTDAYAYLDSFYMAKQELEGWHEIQGFDVKLDPTQTENNIWFVVLFEDVVQGGSSASWTGAPDADDYIGAHLIVFHILMK